MKKSTKGVALAGIAVLSFFAVQQRSVAGTATWATQPISGDWSTVQNWVPQTVPNAGIDTATFKVSSMT